MKITKLIRELEHRLKIIRKYSNGGCDWPEYDLKQYASYLRRDSNCIGHDPVIDKKTFTASDMTLLGPGSQKDLGLEWSLPLPEDYLEFCSRFDDYLFVGGSFFVMGSASDIRDSLIAARITENDINFKQRLFYFASTLAMPGYFSFRWSQNYKEMDVVFVWDCGDVGENDLRGEPGDRFSSDPDFTSWLERMIETDGNPLFPGKQWPMADGEWFDDEYPYFKRIPNER